VRGHAREVILRHGQKYKTERIREEDIQNRDIIRASWLRNGVPVFSMSLVSPGIAAVIPNGSSDFHSCFMLLSGGLYPALSKMRRAAPGKSRMPDDCGSAEEGRRADNEP